jgi:hypothetical protein
MGGGGGDVLIEASGLIRSVDLSDAQLARGDRSPRAGPPGEAK